MFSTCSTWTATTSGRYHCGIGSKCVDAGTRLTIGCPTIPRGPDGSRPEISAVDVVVRIGGYRLASAAVDIEGGELVRRTRRISHKLRSRRRLWCRHKI